MTIQITINIESITDSQLAWVEGLFKEVLYKQGLKVISFDSRELTTKALDDLEEVLLFAQKQSKRHNTVRIVLFENNQYFTATLDYYWRDDYCQQSKIITAYHNGLEIPLRGQ